MRAAWHSPGAAAAAPALERSPAAEGRPVLARAHAGRVRRAAQPVAVWAERGKQLARSSEAAAVLLEELFCALYDDTPRLNPDTAPEFPLAFRPAGGHDAADGLSAAAGADAWATRWPRPGRLAAGGAAGRRAGAAAGPPAPLAVAARPPRRRPAPCGGRPAAAARGCRAAPLVRSSRPCGTCGAWPTPTRCCGGRGASAPAGAASTRWTTSGAPWKRCGRCPTLRCSPTRWSSSARCWAPCGAGAASRRAGAWSAWSGWETGSDLERVIPEETARLGRSRLAALVRGGVRAPAAAANPLRRRGRGPTGPIVCCMDVSRSMNTPAALGRERFLWAKAVALALLDLARRTRRPSWACVLPASTSWRRLSSPPAAAAPETAAAMAACDFDGGTHFQAPLEHALRHLEQAAGRGGGHIVFITDGEAQLPERSGAGSSRPRPA